MRGRPPHGSGTPTDVTGDSTPDAVIREAVSHKKSSQLRHKTFDLQGKLHGNQ
jgi:hypothetical protein